MKDQAFEPNLIDAYIIRLSTNYTRTFTKKPINLGHSCTNEYYFKSLKLIETKNYMEK